MSSFFRARNAATWLAGEEALRSSDSMGGVEGRVISAELQEYRLQLLSNVSVVVIPMNIAAYFKPIVITKTGLLICGFLTCNRFKGIAALGLCF